MTEQEIRTYELILLDAGNDPDKVLMILRSRRASNVPKSEVEQLISNTPSRIDIVAVWAGNENSSGLETELRDAGAQLERHEIFVPFFGFRAYFDKWLEEHPNTREAYRFTFMPPNWITPFSVWLWHDWSGKHHALAQLGLQPIKIEDATTIAQEKLWTPSDDTVLTAWDLFEQHNFWSSDIWPDRGGGIDGATWFFEGYRNGNYKRRSCWEPHEGAAYEIGVFFHSLIPSEFGTVEF